MFLLGLFLRSQRRLRESAEQLVMAAQLSPTNSVRAASAARALRDARRCRSAERWYARAVELSPDVSHRIILKFPIVLLQCKCNSTVGNFASIIIILLS